VAYLALTSGRALHVVYARTGSSAVVGQAAQPTNAMLFPGAAVSSFTAAPRSADDPAALVAQPASWGAPVLDAPTVSDDPFDTTIIEVP